MKTKKVRPKTFVIKHHPGSYKSQGSHKGHLGLKC